MFYNFKFQPQKIHFWKTLLKCKERPFLNKLVFFSIQTIKVCSPSLNIRDINICKNILKKNSYYLLSNKQLKAVCMQLLIKSWGLLLFYLPAEVPIQRVSLTGRIVVTLKQAVLCCLDNKQKILLQFCSLTYIIFYQQKCFLVILQRQVKIAQKYMSDDSRVKLLYSLSFKLLDKGV